MLVATGTGTRHICPSDISYTSTGNSIAKRNVDGNLMANALILGGTETNVVMDVSGTNVRVKTPDGEIVLQASGTGDNPNYYYKVAPSIDNGDYRYNN